MRKKKAEPSKRGREGESGGAALRWKQGRKYVGKKQADKVPQGRGRGPAPLKGRGFNERRSKDTKKKRDLSGGERPPSPLMPGLKERSKVQ